MHHHDLLEGILQTYTEIPAVHMVSRHFLDYLHISDHTKMAWMRKRGIQVLCLRRLNPILVPPGGPLDRLLLSLAVKYTASPRAVLRRWAFEKDVIPLRVSDEGERMGHSFDPIAVRVSSQDLKMLNKVEREHHVRVQWWGETFAS